MAERDTLAQRGALAADISREMVKILSRYTGRGPTRARTTLNRNIAVVVFQDTLTKAELNLVAAGEIEAVLQMRRIFQGVMRDEAIAAVEGVLNRTVQSLTSDVDPLANIAVQVFLFEPEPEDHAVGVGAAGDLI
jgi:uncharacterized protein YbcI